MNKQQFKKAVEAVGASMCDEMMTVYYNVEGADRDKISVAVAKVLGATGAAKANANRFFDRGQGLRQSGGVHESEGGILQEAFRQDPQGLQRRDLRSSEALQ